MTYHQITALERYIVMAMRVQGASPAQIARALGRHRSTIIREIARTSTNHDDYYRPVLADSYARMRRARSRRNTHFTPADWIVDALLCEDWSPEQVVGWCARFHLLAISIETIYRHIWADKKRGGTLHGHLRRANKPFRKRYAAYDSRGRLAGKRPIESQPAGAAHRLGGHLKFPHLWPGQTPPLKA